MRRCTSVRRMCIAAVLAGHSHRNLAEKELKFILVVAACPFYKFIS